MLKKAFHVILFLHAIAFFLISYLALAGFLPEKVTPSNQTANLHAMFISGVVLVVWAAIWAKQPSMLAIKDIADGKTRCKIIAVKIWHSNKIDMLVTIDELVMKHLRVDGKLPITYWYSKEEFSGITPDPEHFLYGKEFTVEYDETTVDYHFKFLEEI